MFDTFTFKKLQITFYNFGFYQYKLLVDYALESVASQDYNYYVNCLWILNLSGLLPQNDKWQHSFQT